MLSGWPTRNAYVEVREVKANEFHHKLEDFFSRGWNGRCDGKLVECIHDDICGPMMCLEDEHFFEAFYHNTIIRSLYSTIGCGI